MTRGWFGIGICHGKNSINIGGLWRSAQAFDADFVFTVARRYKRQPDDTQKTWRHIPLWHFNDLSDLRAHLPYECVLIGVETEGDQYLPGFEHPERAIYLLGAEDHGLTNEALNACHRIVRIPGERCLNVASAGTVILYDRHAKRGTLQAMTEPSLPEKLPDNAALPSFVHNEQELERWTICVAIAKKVMERPVGHQDVWYMARELYFNPHYTMP